MGRDVLRPAAGLAALHPVCGASAGAPQGNYLANKSGAPLPCGTNKVASDHRPVFADLRVR